MYGRSHGNRVLITRGGFAVIDVETSGFSPQKNRIVEVGIVLVDESGESVHSWSSRFNPEGPVGPTHIHGIRAEDVTDAPLFADEATRLVELLSGHVFVAHNVRFDLGFIRAEFERAGWSVPQVPTLCTQEASWHYLNGLEKHRLIDCCTAAGITLSREHSALHDAEATAELLRYYLDPSVPPKPRLDHLKLPAAAAVVEWPSAPIRQPAAWTPPPASEQAWTWKKRTVSEPLVKALDAYSLREAIDAGAPENSKAYLELLLLVLEDGILTADEGFSLAELAQMYDLSRDEVKLAHRGFLVALAHQALTDETVSREERDEMRKIAHLLDMPEEIVTDAISNARGTRHTRHASTIETGELPADWSLGEPLRVGDRVAFTGCDPGQRAALESRAKELGVRIANSVSKKTAMLVTDGGFAGGKAAQAEAAGTRLVHPDDFATFLDHIQPAIEQAPKRRNSTRVVARSDDGGGDASEDEVATASQSTVDPAAVRAWARANGIEVGDRGRLHRDLIDAYNAAHSA